MKKFAAFFVALFVAIFMVQAEALARGGRGGGFSSGRSSYSYSRPSYSAPARNVTVYKSYGSSGGGFGSSFAGAAAGAVVGNALSRPAAPVVVNGGAPVAGGMAPIAPIQDQTNGWDFLNNLLGLIFALIIFGVIGIGLFFAYKSSKTKY